MEIIDDLIRINKYSRPGTKLKKIKYVAIHYTGDAGCPGTRTRDYFNNLPDINAAIIAKAMKEGKEIPELTYVSSQYVIDLDGKIIRCIPEDEMAYCQSSNNSAHISIECSHPDDGGKFTDATYASLVWLVADICRRYNLDVDKSVKRHYDFTKKVCPRYYVKNPDAWIKMKSDIKDELLHPSDDGTTEKIMDKIKEKISQPKDKIIMPPTCDDEIEKGDTVYFNGDIYSSSDGTPQFNRGHREGEGVIDDTFEGKKAGYRIKGLGYFYKESLRKIK
jgi:hypothetical protein